MQLSEDNSLLAAHKTRHVDLVTRLKRFNELTKPRQTALLLFTGIGTYIASTGFQKIIWNHLAFLVGMTYLTVSGTTILNMVFDRDIDKEMGRTKKRPIPQGIVHVKEATAVGLALIILGIAGAAYWLNTITAMVLFAGTFFDLPIYTIWLKRRHRYSIIFGGIAGGMPALAGRTAVIGRIDLIGILLVVFISTWVPIHILTLAIVYQDDYDKVGVPMWPVQVGNDATLRFIAFSSVIAALTILYTAVLFNVYLPVLLLFSVSSTWLIYLCLKNLYDPTISRNWTIFKFASIYMSMAFFFLPFHP